MPMKDWHLQFVVIYQFICVSDRKPFATSAKFCPMNLLCHLCLSKSQGGLFLPSGLSGCR